MRLIDADNLYKKFIDGETDTEEEKSQNQLARYLIRHEPTVNAAPVVYCYECEHMKENKDMVTVFCTAFRRDMKKDDFCSYGAKMDGGTL